MDSLPLHHCTVHRSWAIVHRSHTFLHSIALTAMVYYRASSFLYHENTLATPTLPFLVVFASELVLSLLWLLNQAYLWRPVSRTVFPERLPADEQLPAIDVFICTADPKKEPPVEVMNTVLSAMALDYPPDKLSIYLSDDGGSSLTLYATREAWGFARLWIPFCGRFGIKTRCPKAYFSTLDDDHGDSIEFPKEREKIERKYEELKERLRRAGEKVGIKDTGALAGQSFPPVIEVMRHDTINEFDSEQAKMPLLVYVSREKKPPHPHHFKAGALNVLLRVSGVISNAPYILMLDCDMYSNDPTSARQAMCFHLDPKISPSLAFVQFPQKFHNISKNDIYDSQARSIFMVKWPGMDGLKGPMLSGTCFYMKRKALYGSDIQKDSDLLLLKQSFGPSNEFTKSLSRGFRYVIDSKDSLNTLLPEAQVVASGTYEKDTQWGQQIGFLYDSVVEDYFTGFILHCNGWNSVYCNPSRPAFLGTAPTSLNESLVQGRRWNCGVLEVAFSRFCPLIYGPSRMSFLQNMCYGHFAFQPFYFFSVWCFATIPQLCLLNGIPLYPKVSSSWFIILSFIFLSSLLKHLWDILYTGGSIQTWRNEWRVWMIKSVTAYFYGSLDAILKLVGMRKATFIPTNKVSNEEQIKLYQMGIYNFQTSTMLLAPLVTLVILNVVSFTGGIARAIFTGEWKEMFAQIFLSFFIIVMNYPVIEGMILRKDKGRVPPSVTLLSVVFSFIFLSLGSIVLMYT
ncbi:hypothetical protein F0562_035393 [Nyssa sinensis]|uniref:Cellulose synthase-like protein G2 n=1 Tax=Nyssa sinensis TaxID=561372 RepID=A0A5J5ACB3_9ASTE|nr:hypothetical protein F0562_035393 [Nyssa sinensis]